MTDHHTFETQAGGILQCEICRHQYEPAIHPTIPVHLYHTTASPLVPPLRQSTCTVPPLVQLPVMYYSHASPLVPYLHQSNCTTPSPVHLYCTSTSPLVPYLRQSTGTATPPVHRYRNSASPQVPQLRQSTCAYCVTHRF